MKKTQLIITPVTTERQNGAKGIVRFGDIKELKYFLNHCVCCHQGELMKTFLVRELGKEVGFPGFDERYRISADTDMLLRAHIKAVPIHYVFKYFACFHLDGFADSNVEIYKKEDYDSFVRALSLNEGQATYYAKRKYFPICILLRLIIHSDLAVRIAARYMMKCWLKDVFRVFLWPLVIIRRKIRDSKRKCV